MNNLTLTNKFNQEQLVQWAKAILFVGILMCLMSLAYATDSTGVADLDKQATAFQSGIKTFAKWGGICMIVVTGVIFGSGKAQGQTAQLLTGVVLAIGLIMGAWGWFSSNFSYGFAF